MNCRTAHKRPSSHLTWPVSPPVGSYRLQPPLPFIIITQPERWYSFTVPRRVEGWVDLGTAGRVHTARAQGCKSQWFFYDKHNCPQRHSIPGPHALQSDMLPLDHCYLQCQLSLNIYSRRQIRWTVTTAPDERFWAHLPAAAQTILPKKVGLEMTLEVVQSHNLVFWVQLVDCFMYV